MGYYDVMQVCLNGHQITSRYNESPQFRQDYCDKCGKQTVYQCSKCGEPIRGKYISKGVLDLTSVPVPSHCHKCGSPYPWRKNSDKDSINFKLLATEFGESVKYETSINEINRVFSALVDFSSKNHPNDAITSARSQLIYDWILTIAESELNQEEKIKIIIEAINSLVVDEKTKVKLLKLCGFGSSITKNLSFSYVHNSRIEELQKIENKKFDLTRLIKLCEELNQAFQNQSHLSVAMIIRAILDHIPPIFGYKTFIEVANNYGSKSFKGSMQNLENSSRKIADSFLHSQIRQKEVLPTSNQVDFSNDLDVLLGEIYRILK